LPSAGATGLLAVEAPEAASPRQVASLGDGDHRKRSFQVYARRGDEAGAVGDLEESAGIIGVAVGDGGLNAADGSKSGKGDTDGPSPLAYERHVELVEVPGDIEVATNVQRPRFGCPKALDAEEYSIDVSPSDQVAQLGQDRPPLGRVIQKSQ
jgi:hypothetical protein